MPLSHQWRCGPQALRQCFLASQPKLRCDCCTWTHPRNHSQQSFQLREWPHNGRELPRKSAIWVSSQMSRLTAQSTPARFVRQVHEKDLATAPWPHGRSWCTERSCKNMQYIVLYCFHMFSNVFTMFTTFYNILQPFTSYTNLHQLPIPIKILETKSKYCSGMWRYAKDMLGHPRSSKELQCIWQLHLNLLGTRRLFHHLLPFLQPARTLSEDCEFFFIAHFFQLVAIPPEQYQARWKLMRTNEISWVNAIPSQQVSL